ncbi:EpsG family protein [Leptospira sp. 201903075]|uniref:EpsG family protein n=1 Tax=Leptospira chreensis TaxID=2810035 RepID=UPI0019627D87|nr:EpsG family protein [Leptospira chreensis]MBM9590248.1 EpsG family protein [Leptospira chreensis]
MKYYKEFVLYLFRKAFFVERRVAAFFDFFNLGEKAKFWNQHSFNFTIILLLVMIPYSPVVSVFLSFFILVLYSERLPKTFRVGLGLILIIGQSVVIASRERLVSPSDDLNYYYWFYNHISGDFSNWEGMVYTDFLFYFVLKLFKSYLPYLLSPDFFLFLFSILSSGFFFLWLELYAVSQFKIKYRAVIIGISLFYFGYFMSTQAVRQMIALPLTLIAFSAFRNWKGILILVIATLVHSSSVLMFFLLWLSKLSLKKSLSVLFVGLIFLKLLQPFLIQLVQAGIVPNASVIGSLYSYLNLELREDHKVFFFAILRITFFSLVGFIIFRPNKQEFYRNVYFLFLAAYILFFQYPFLPLRLGMLTFFVLVGFLKIVSVYRVINVYRIFVILVSINYLRIHLFMIPKESTGFNLFFSIPAYSFEPFYYFFKIFNF